MYQVYSQQRPGRPTLAVISTALLLVLTIGMAWGVMEYKGRGQPVELGESQVFENGGIRCRLPMGWEVKPTKDLPRIVVSVDEPVSSDLNFRKLLLFRSSPHQLALPSIDAVAAIKQINKGITPGGKLQDYGFGRIGVLPGWTVGSVSLLSDGRPIYGLARAAVAPQGQMVGVILISSNPVKRGDRQLLDQISEHIELLDVLPADGEKVMASAGIQFSKPQDAVFFSEPSRDMPRVQMVGGEDQETWYLDAYCVPLMGARTPAELVTDHYLTSLKQINLAEPVESTKIQNRNFAEKTIAGSEGAKPSVIVACVQTEEHTGLLLIGRYETGAKETLRDLVHTIAREAVVTPYGERTNLAAAEDAARQWIKTIGTKGISEDFDSERTHRQEYSIQSAAMTTGRELRQMISGPQDGVLWWGIAVKLNLESDGVVVYDALEEWTVRDDGAAHTYDYRISSRSIKATYSEKRELDTQQVHRQLAIQREAPREVITSVSDTYAAEPVLMRAAARMAWLPNPEPAIFNSTEPFAKESVYWVLTPMGRVEQSDNPGDKTLAAVRLQRDFDPAPITLYFNEQRVLVAVGFDSGRWQIMEGESLPVDIVR